MSRQLKVSRIPTKYVTHNFQQILRLKNLNKDHRSALSYLNIEKDSDNINNKDKTTHNPLIKLPQSKKFTETARANIKGVHNSHAQLSSFLDRHIFKQRKKITPKNDYGLESSRDNKRSLSQNNNHSNHLQYVKNMRIEFHKARKHLIFEDLSAKSNKFATNICNLTGTCQAFHSHSYKNRQQINERLQTIRSQTQVDENKARYSDIPMVEFLYQNGGRSKTLSRSLQRKLEKMRRGPTQGKTGLRG